MFEPLDIKAKENAGIIGVNSVHPLIRKWIHYSIWPAFLGLLILGFLYLVHLLQLTLSSAIYDSLSSIALALIGLSLVSIILLGILNTINNIW